MKIIDLDKLEAVARAATQGTRHIEQDRNEQWHVYAEDSCGNGREWLALLPHQCVVSIAEKHEKDAALFEATSPEVILALIRRVREAEGEIVLLRNSRAELEDVACAAAQ